MPAIGSIFTQRPPTWSVTTPACPMRPTRMPNSPQSIRNGAPPLPPMPSKGASRDHAVLGCAMPTRLIRRAIRNMTRIAIKYFLFDRRFRQDNPSARFDIAGWYFISMNPAWRQGQVFGVAFDLPQNPSPGQRPHRQFKAPIESTFIAMVDVLPPCIVVRLKYIDVLRRFH